MLEVPKVVILAFLVSCSSATYTYIAGYEPQSEVVEHSEIDLDVQEIISLLPAADSGDLNNCDNCDWETDAVYIANLAEARDIWLNGKYSAKTTSNRSIAGFSSGAEDKNSGNDATRDVMYRDNSYISVMNEYWESKSLNKYTWGYDIIDAAFSGITIGDINFGTVGDDFRREVIQKGIVYLNVFPYVIWEMQDAVNDCNNGNVTFNDNSVHAWDEAVAFYTGSIEGTSKGGVNGLDSGSDGQLQFMLADKRCMNFGTCTADRDLDNFAGYSNVNKDIFALFAAGRDEILGAKHTSECPQVPDLMDEISGLMLIPFIQGVQRYLVKTGIRETPSAKEAGELFAFASAVLPFIHKADPEVAEILYEVAWNLEYNEHDWRDIKTKIEKTYPLLGVGAGEGVVTCIQVGELTDLNGVKEGSEACVDAIESEDDGGSESIAAWAIGLIVALAVLLIIAIIYVYFIRQKYVKALPLIDNKEDVEMTK